MDYCLEEDAAFAKLPTNNSYAGQVELRRELRAKWSH
jgi:hypothetical protein